MVGRHPRVSCPIHGPRNSHPHFHSVCACVRTRAWASFLILKTLKIQTMQSLLDVEKLRPVKKEILFKQRNKKNQAHSQLTQKKRRKTYLCSNFVSSLLILQTPEYRRQGYLSPVTAVTADYRRQGYLSPVTAVTAGTRLQTLGVSLSCYSCHCRLQTSGVPLSCYSCHCRHQTTDVRGNSPVTAVTADTGVNV